MNKIVNFFKKNFFLGATILLGIYFLGEVLNCISFFNEDPGQVLAGIFLLIVNLALIAVFVILFIKRNMDAVKTLLIIMLVAFSYDSFREFPVSFMFVSAEGIVAVYSIFDVILLAAVAFVFVLYIISLISKKLSKLQAIVKIIALVIIPFSIVVGILYICALAKFNSYWANYLAAVGKYFAFIPLMAITYIVYFYQEGPKKEKPAEEPKEENKPSIEEKPAAEEKPASESKYTKLDDKYDA